MKTLSLVLAVAAVAGPAAAQTEIRAALSDARAAAAAAAAPKTPSSCSDAQELETPFEMTVTFADGRAPLELKFAYAGCQEEGRNDYLPPYTTRSYKSAEGYELVVVTNEGAEQSDVLLAKGNAWVGRFGDIANAALTSGDPQTAGGVTVASAGGELKGQAVLRDSAKPMYPQLKGCETADWSQASATGAPARSGGKPVTGYDNYRGAPSLVLLTKTAAYYYHEDCDICAEVTRCDLNTRALTTAAVGHSVGCGDMRKYRSEPGVVYDSCADSR